MGVRYLDIPPDRWMVIDLGGPETPVGAQIHKNGDHFATMSNGTAYELVSGAKPDEKTRALLADVYGRAT